MTKAQVKRYEREKRQIFIARVYTIILNSIPDCTKESTMKFEIKLMHRNYDRYIKLHSPLQDINFKLYGDGNISIELKDFSFSRKKHREQLFKYVDDFEKQNMFMARLTKILQWLMKVYTNQEVLDFHSYMTYISETGDMEEAYYTMMAEYWGSSK